MIFTPTVSRAVRAVFLIEWLAELIRRDRLRSEPDFDAQVEEELLDDEEDEEDAEADNEA